MLMMLLRIVTLNFFLLGFFIKPKWKKERKKIEGRRWEVRLSIRPCNLLKGGDAGLKEFLRDCFPWLSPKEIGYICKGWREYYTFYGTCEDFIRVLSHQEYGKFRVDSKHLTCCGGEILHGDCGCISPGESELLLPVAPIPLDKVG
jgi:hypothetical protein